MILFIISILVLVVGYFVYSRIVEKNFAPDDRITPAVASRDDVDFIPLPTWKAFLIQLLNIAGTGPIFGAIMGAVFGPVVFLWIILGSIFGGVVHDYMAGMISSRHNGASVAELSGLYIGKVAKWIMRVFSIILLVLVGTVFINSPAVLLATLTPDILNHTFWLFIIVIYFVLATLLPIDKIIGRFYPLFGAVLIIMAVGIVGALYILPQYSIPEITLQNLHPDNLPIWPFMFVTVACGAISGFHSTQAPLVSKCIVNERVGRKVFSGAMLAESVIALVWAAAGVAFYGASEALNGAIETLGQSGVIYEISTNMLGPVGGVLAIIGVIICPITSGDTAFRSARLIIAESIGLGQKSVKNRLIITLPLLGIGALLTQLDFDVLWRYFSWSNQVLATISLVVATAYLLKKGKYRFSSLVTAVPAIFMSAVCGTYILMSPEGFQLSTDIAYPVGFAVGVLFFIGYIIMFVKQKHKEEQV